MFQCPKWKKVLTEFILLTSLLTVKAQEECDSRNCTIKPHLPCTIVHLPFGNCDVPSLADDSPPKPTRMSLEIRYKVESTSNISEQYLHIEWEAPQGGGITFVKGFEISIMIASGDSVGRSLGCIFFNLSNAVWTNEDSRSGQSIFSYDCLYPLGPHANQELLVQIYSYPRPRAGNIDQRVSQFITVPGPGNGPPCPNTWNTTVHLQFIKTSYTLNVTFSKGKAEFNYTKYIVEVIYLEGGIPKKSEKEKKLEAKDFPKTKYLTYDFPVQGLACPGTYMIWMRPWVGDYRCCDCDNKTCNHCKTSKSNVVTLQSTDCPPSDNPTPIIGIVVGVVLGVLLITIFLVCLVYCKNARENENNERVERFIQEQGPDHPGDDPEDPLQTPIIGSSFRYSKRPKSKKCSPPSFHRSARTK